MKSTESGRIMNCDVLIVGGGLAGLTLAESLHKKGADFILLERSDSIGGLCSSWQGSDGSWHDFGPHIYRFNDDDSKLWFEDHIPASRELERLDQIMLASGTIVDYPVQTSCAHMIEPDLSFDPDESYYHHCMHFYGKKLCDEFFIPYNKKYYSLDLEGITSAVTKRLPVSGSQKGLYKYPVSGSYSEVPESVARRLPKSHLLCNKTVLYVDYQRKNAYTSNAVYHYKRLAWCAPVELISVFCRTRINLNYIDLVLETTKGESEGFLARYNADVNSPYHRISNEATLKGTGKNNFLQYETNIYNYIVRQDCNLYDTFVIPAAYPVPTKEWSEKQIVLKESLLNDSIYLNGRSGNGIHKESWTVISESNNLADFLCQ